MRIVLALMILVSTLLLGSADTQATLPLTHAGYSSLAGGPSPNGTVVLAGSSSPIIDSGGQQWTITSIGCTGTAPCIAYNGAPWSITSGVAQIAYVNGVVYQQNTGGFWYSMVDGPAAGSVTGSTQSPLTSPNDGLVTTVAAVTAGVNSPAIVDSAFNNWTLATSGCSGATPCMAINGTPITATNTVSNICFDSGNVWERGAGAYWFKVATISGAGTTFGSAVATAPNTACGTSYIALLATSQNPVSESGVWINGLATGLDWANVGAVGGSPGHFFGGTPMVNEFGDASAVLAPGTGGAWGQNQTVTATVTGTNPTTGCCVEVELRLNMSITAHTQTGYEFDCSMIAANPYAVIVRWNGPLATGGDGAGNNGYDTIGGASGAGTHVCAVGDVLRGTNVGGVITFTINGVVIGAVATDTTYMGGTPGVGFDNINSGYAYTSYGIGSWYASSP